MELCPCTGLDRTVSRDGDGRYHGTGTDYNGTGDGQHGIWEGPVIPEGWYHGTLTGHHGTGADSITENRSVLQVRAVSQGGG